MILPIPTFFLSRVRCSKRSTYDNVNPAVSIGADVCSCLNASLVRLNDVIFHSDKITMDGRSRPRNCDNIDTISKKVIALMAMAEHKSLGWRA